MQLAPAAHEGVAGFREEKRVAALGVGDQQAALEQDVDELPHAHGGLLAHDAVGRERVEAETADLLALAACEHGGDDDFAEMQPPLVETVDAGQDLARVHRRVYFFKIRVAVSAVTAADGRFFTEVVEDIPAQTVGRRCVERHLTEALHIALDERTARFLVDGVVVVLVAVLDEKFRSTHILPVVQQDAVRGFAVASGASGLLIIAFHVLRHIIVNDERNIGLVDAHAEGVGRDHDGLAVVQEVVLIGEALLGVETGVVARCGQAAAQQHVAHLLDRLARRAVDDAALVAPLEQVRKQGGGLGGRFFDREVQIGAVEAGRDDERVLETERTDDVVADLGGRGRGEGGNERALGQGGKKVEDLQIARAEILSPLRDAVRLVHRHHGNRHAACEIEEERRGQPLGRDIEQLVLAASGEIQRVAHLLERQGAVDAGGRDAGLIQRADLILHQRDERRDDERQSGQRERRDLIADGLAGAGRHDAERVAPGKNGLHELVLSRTEAVVAEVLFENFLCGRHVKAPSYIV